jgi:NAD-dependent DNA ligase
LFHLPITDLANPPPPLLPPIPPQSKALQDLRFVITGITDELPGEEFKAVVSGLIEAAGGRVTSGISGVTDYLVCGTIHYNPFTGSVGPIESGSKYKKAMTSAKCSIISKEQLEALIEAGADSDTE